MTLKIYNLGEAAAKDVKIDDTTWQAVTGAVFQKTFATIEAGDIEEVTYNVIPETAGKVLATVPAKLTYKAAGSDDMQASFSNNIHDKGTGIRIITQAEYEKKTSRRVKEWLTFLLLLVVPLGIPLYFHQQSANQLAAKRSQIKADEAKYSSGNVKKSSSPTKRKSSPGKKN